MCSQDDVMCVLCVCDYACRPRSLPIVLLAQTRTHNPTLDAAGAAAQAVERENATEEGIPLPVKYSGVTGRVAGGLYRVVVKNKSTEQAVATLKVR